ncbi:MAG: hypothetical protein JO236_00010 [Mycobacterium sp.]|uniref:hypothetical protein n=1 Tax=Mycobacterium sp. TaxID=1785 RepID=UPI001EC52271|nr:hypothetical protein [Mycobacterium sp.]MBW0015925.1 hypothetical protein [Mycobacterium sp.]
MTRSPLVVLGSEAVARGSLTRGQLRWNYRKIHRDVYLPKEVPRSLRANIHAAWLWSGRTGVIAGRAAAALYGAKWIDDFTPVELIGPFNHAPPGVIIRRERVSSEDIVQMAGLPVTTPARTAFDLARHLPRSAAVAHLDALSAATGLINPDVVPLITRSKGTRGVRQCREALSLMDGGAESPKESWLRLLLIDAGLPRPVTQIRISDGRLIAYLDMGWEDPKVALEYDGDQHRTDRTRYVKDIQKWELIDRLGWKVIRVIKEDRPNVVLDRTREALARRTRVEIAGTAVIPARSRP